jgi:membrane-bound lytic murein transglycosylase B
MSRPAEKSKAWYEYRNIFVTDTRTSRGQKFWLENIETLERAEKEFGVDPATVCYVVNGKSWAHVGLPDHPVNVGRAKAAL